MRRRAICLVVAALLLPGCVAPGYKEAMQLGPESLANRQMQTRRFETANNDIMLGAAAGVLQDLGFTLDESEYELGVLVGSKQRDATSGAQIAGAIFLGALTGQVSHVDHSQTIRVSMVMREITPKNTQEQAMYKLTPEVLQRVKTDVTNLVAAGLRKHFPNEVSQKLAAKIADSTAKTLTSDLSKAVVTRGSGESTVRVTFQRVVHNTAGQVSRLEQINESALYQEFFNKLSQAVFLEAHEL